MIFIEIKHLLYRGKFLGEIIEIRFVEIEIVENKLGSKLPQLEYHGSESSNPQVEPEVSPEIKPDVISENQPEIKTKRKLRKFVGNIVEIKSDDQIDSIRRQSRNTNNTKRHGRDRSGCVEIVGHLVIDNGKKTRKQVTKKSQKIVSDDNPTTTSAGYDTRKEIIPLKRNKTRKGVYTKSNTDKRVRNLNLRIGSSLR